MCDLYCCLGVCLVVVAIGRVSLDNISFETLKRAIWHLDAHLAVIAGHGGVLRCGTDWAAHPLSLARSLKVNKWKPISMQQERDFNVQTSQELMTRCLIWDTIELHRDTISKVLSEW